MRSSTPWALKVACIPRPLRPLRCCISARCFENSSLSFLMEFSSSSITNLIWSGVTSPVPRHVVLPSPFARAEQHWSLWLSCNTLQLSSKISSRLELVIKHWSSGPQILAVAIVNYVYGLNVLYGGGVHDGCDVEKKWTGSAASWLTGSVDWSNPTPSPWNEEQPGPATSPWNKQQHRLRTTSK